MREGKEVPIHFLSKSFDDRMSRWSTIQQEGYAIYYAITSWEHLLRDRRFLVRTDHANLKLLHAESNPKVIRWMLSLQMYDFDIEHIAGKENTIADGFSRLCSDDRSSSDTRMIESFERENEKDPEILGSIDLLDILDTSDPPSIPKVFLMLGSGEIDWHLEIWALDYTKYEVMSDELIQSYLSTVHNDVAGHFGVNKTLGALRNLEAVREAIVKEPLLLRGLRARCRRYINECPACQKHAFDKIRNRATPFTVSEYSIMDTFMIDYIEGLPEDIEGYQNIIVIVDCFSRWCTLQARRPYDRRNLQGSCFSTGHCLVLRLD